MTASSPPPAPHLAEVKPLTFVDHVVNIFHLVIKELRSIRADPTMLDPGRLRLQHLGQHGGHRRSNRGDQSLGRHRRRGRLGPVAADRRGASAADLPAAGAHHGFRDRPVDGSGQAPVRGRDSAELRGGRPRPAQDRHSDQCRRDGGRPGWQWRRLPQHGDRQRDREVHLRAGGRDRGSDQSRCAGRLQPEPQDGVVLGDDAGHQPDHAARRSSSPARR